MVEIKRNTVFQVKEDYDVSFTNFFEGLFLLPFAEKTREQYKKCFGTEIPEDLRKMTESLFKKSWQFLLQRDLQEGNELESWKIDDLGELVKSNGVKFLKRLEDNIENVEKIHKENWQRFSEERKQFIKLIEKITENYGKYMLSEIERITKIPWQAKEITIYPVFNINNRQLGNCLLLIFSTRDLTEEDEIVTLVHETVHANTNPIWKKYREKEEENLLDAHEIATHIVASLVVKNLNKKFDKEFPTKVKFFEEKIRTNVKKLENFCKKSKDFEEFLFRVQKFLNKIEYESILEGGEAGKDYAKIFKN